jgi:serine/threonine protein kinase
VASCSSLDNRQESLAKFGNVEFNPDVWAISNEYVRGTMIHDFLKQNSPITDKDRSFIIHQLGNSTAYFEYDVNPAYYIGSSPKVGRLKAYLVAFIIDQQTGRVRDIQVYPELE